VREGNRDARYSDAGRRNGVVRIGAPREKRGKSKRGRTDGCKEYGKGYITSGKKKLVGFSWNQSFEWDTQLDIYR